MRKVKIFLGEPYAFAKIVPLEDKFVITCEGADGENYAFLDEDAKAVFPTKEDAEKWWDSKDTKYNDTEICVW